MCCDLLLAGVERQGCDCAGYLNWWAAFDLGNLDQGRGEQDGFVLKGVVGHEKLGIHAS